MESNEINWAKGIRKKLPPLNTRSPTENCVKFHKTLEELPLSLPTYQRVVRVHSVPVHVSSEH